MFKIQFVLSVSRGLCVAVMMVFKVICLTILVFGFAQSAVLPEQKCKLSDSACLATAFQKMLPIFMSGIPDANVEVLDTMKMEDLAFDLAGLKFTLKDGEMKGMKNIIIDKVDWDTKKKVFSTTYHMDGSVKGHYTAGGRILILPITGDGQMKLKLKNLEMTMHIHYDVVKGEDGKDHIKPKKYSFEFDVKDNAHYHLTNLFNGNKQLSEAMLTFLNENWKQIATEFGTPMIEVAAKKTFKNIVNYLDAMPLDDITIV